MLRNNAKLGGFVTYFDIQFVGQSWFAWYYLEIKSAEDLPGGE